MKEGEEERREAGREGEEEGGGEGRWSRMVMISLEEREGWRRRTRGFRASEGARRRRSSDILKELL